MDRERMQWTKTPDNWQATISDATGRVWEVRICREQTSIHRPIIATMFSKERAVDGELIGGRYRSNSTFQAFTEAETWVYETLGLGETSCWGR